MNTTREARGISLEDVRLAHAIPGRVRFKIESLKGDDQQAEEIERELSTISGIDQAIANSLTGSVLVRYDPALTQSLEFQLAVANALGIILSDLEPSRLAAWYAGQMNTPESQTSLGPAIQRMGESLNSSVANYMGGAGDLRTLIPLALFFLGFRGLLTAEKLAFPSWSDYWWYAFGSYFILNNSTISPSNRETKG